MRTALASLRLVLIVVVTLVLLLVWYVGFAFVFATDRPRRRWRDTMVSFWARTLARLIGMRVRVEGPLPEAPFCLVANHLSYLDIILFQTQLHTLFIAKAAVKGWPGIGWLAQRFDTLFIDRTNKRDVLRVHAQLEAALDRGDSVVFFPEGTSSAGDRIHPFRPPLLAPLARLGRPVHYAAVRYVTPPTAPPASVAVCWWGRMTLADHLFNLLKLPGFDAHLAFGATPLQHDDRKALAQALHAGTEALFEPVAAVPDGFVA